MRAPAGYGLSVFGILLVAVALGLDNFALAVGIGLAGVDGRMRIRLAVVFGTFEAAMPLLGLLLGQHLAHRLGATGQYVAGGVLIAVGIYTAADARWGSDDEVPSAARLGPLLVAGAALSIDNLIVGFALGSYQVPIVLAAVVIGVVSVGMALVGLEVGSRLGGSVERWSGEAGGALLVGVGLAFLTGLL